MVKRDQETFLRYLGLIPFAAFAFGIYNFSRIRYIAMHGFLDHSVQSKLNEKQ